jgi:hypothetical protein
MPSPNTNNTPLAALPSVPDDILIYSISKHKVKKEEPEARVSKEIFPRGILTWSKMMILWHISYDQGILATTVLFFHSFGYDAIARSSRQ